MTYHRPLVDSEEHIYAEFKKVVIKAIEEMGMEEFKKTSFFGSNKV
jgi:hypothetical protein